VSRYQKKHSPILLYLQINCKVHAPCDLNFILIGEGLLKVTGNHVHWNSGNMSEMVLYRDVITTGH